MQTNLENLTPTKVKLTITADQPEIKSAKQEALNRLAVNVKVPGFRTGKAPINLVEKQLDVNAVAQETLEAAVNQLYAKAVINHRLRPVQNPSVNVRVFVPDDQLTFEAEVEVVGDVTVGKYQSLGVSKTLKTVKAADVNAVIERLRGQLATKQELDRPAKDGDEVSINFKGIDKATKEPISGASGNDYPLVLGSHSFIPGFEEELIGLKPGESKTFDITFPKDYGVASLQNKPVTFEVSVSTVSERVLPELNDDFAKLVGPFKNLEELKTDVKAELARNNESEAESELENDIVTSIVRDSKVSIPDSLLEEEKERIIREQRQNAAYRGQTWAEYLSADGLSEESFADLAAKQAEERIKTGLVLGEIASQLQLMVTEDELNARLSDYEKQYQNDQQMLAELKKPANRQDIKNRLLVEKTVKKLVELNSKSSIQSATKSDDSKKTTK